MSVALNSKLLKVKHRISNVRKEGIGRNGESVLVAVN